MTKLLKQPWPQGSAPFLELDPKCFVCGVEWPEFAYQVEIRRERLYGPNQEKVLVIPKTILCLTCFQDQVDYLYHALRSRNEP